MGNGTAKAITAAGTDVRSALQWARRELAAAEVPSAGLASELILMHVLGRDRTWLYTHTEALIGGHDAANYAVLIAQRASGVPTQYLTGEQEFWGLWFEVTPDVLIPRPETEHVLEVALERTANRRKEALRIVDVGTGSGCIAIALASECPEAEVFATDISAAALSVALRNGRRHSVAERVQFIRGNLLEPFFLDMTAGAQPEFDLIVSNPPYIARIDESALPREVREHEPAVALFGGESGTELYAPLFAQALKLLRPGGVLAIEIGQGALENVRRLLETSTGWSKIESRNDLAGIPRVVSAERLAAR